MTSVLVVRSAKRTKAESPAKFFFHEESSSSVASSSLKLPSPAPATRLSRQGYTTPCTSVDIQSRAFATRSGFVYSSVKLHLCPFEDPPLEAASDDGQCGRRRSARVSLQYIYTYICMYICTRVYTRVASLYSVILALTARSTRHLSVAPSRSSIRVSLFRLTPTFAQSHLVPLSLLLRLSVSLSLSRFTLLVAPSYYLCK